MHKHQLSDNCQCYKPEHLTVCLLIVRFTTYMASNAGSIRTAALASPTPLASLIWRSCWPSAEPVRDKWLFHSLLFAHPALCPRKKGLDMIDMPSFINSVTSLLLR